MRPDDIQKLLGGYATGTLTDAEQQALFAAALEDQALSDTFAREKLMGASATNTIYTWDHRCRKNLLERMGGKWEL